jgi:hypothetical protein
MIRLYRFLPFTIGRPPPTGPLLLTGRRSRLLVGFRSDWAVSSIVGGVTSWGMVGLLMAYETPNRTGAVHPMPLGDDLALRGSCPLVRRPTVANGSTAVALDMRPCAECSRQVYDEP